MSPDISEDSFVAPNCVVIGDVVIAHRALISYGCVIRGDENVVSIYPGVVIQENCVITADAAVSTFFSTLVTGPRRSLIAE